MEEEESGLTRGAGKWQAQEVPSLSAKVVSGGQEGGKVWSSETLCLSYQVLVPQESLGGGSSV